MKNKFLFYLFGLYRRYYKTCTSSIVLVIIGSITFILDYTGMSISLFSIPFKWYLTAIPFGSAAILFVFGIATLYLKSYPRRNELNFESIILRWNINNSNGDFSSSIFYTIINKSNSPILEIRGEREGFSSPIKSLPVKYALFGESRQVKIVNISYQLPPTPFIRQINAKGTKTEMHTWEWSIAFSPGIPSHGKIQLLRTLDTFGTEKDAFSDMGTYASWRIIYPTLYLEFNLMAPPRFRFVLLDYYCVDEEGNLNKDELKHFMHPQLMSGESVLIWKIYFPIREHRYRIRYRLEREDLWQPRP